MVDLSEGPPFPHQPGDASAPAQALMGQAGNIQGLSGSLQGSFAPALQATQGDLSGPMAAAPQPAVQGIDEVSSAALFAAGAVQIYESARQTYNTTIDGLNREWSEFSSHAYVPGGATPEQAQAVQDAIDDKLADLRRRQQAAEGTLDDEADSVAGTLRAGPAAMADKTIGDKILGALQGLVIPSSSLGAFGLPAFLANQGLGRTGNLAAWMATVRFGRFAPRGLGGQFISPSSLTAWQRMWASTNSSNWVALPYQSASRAAWLSGLKWTGRVAKPLTVVTSAAEQAISDWDDPTLSTEAKVGRSAYRGAVQGGAAIGGAWAGAQAGAAIGSFGGPVGTVVGGVVGGLVGGAVASGAAGWVVDHTVDAVGDAVDTATDAVGDAVDTVGDAIDDITPW
jgi:hypothetical protein